MKNFQDGALWCDEEVYCIAKEIQLLRPDELSNIGLGWALPATEKFLDVTNITKALYKLGEFFKGAAETSVNEGGDNIFGKMG